MSQPLSTPVIHQQKGFVKTILFAGLIAGTLDIAAAVIMYLFNNGKNPLIIFNFIAGGVFGKVAFTGGTAMIVWGLFFITSSPSCLPFSFSLSIRCLSCCKRMFLLQPSYMEPLYRL